MQKRPAMIYIRRKCIRRRTLRSALVFLALVTVLCCCHVKLLTAMLLSAFVLAVLRLLLKYE